MPKFVIAFIIVLNLSSCDYFKEEDQRIPVARVNDTYLYEEDIQKLISENVTKEDSTLIVHNYITRWATQQLLIDQAKINLSEEKLETYNKLVRDYKNDLYTEGYKNAIVLRQMDSTVSKSEFQDFYNLNKENFRLNDELLKVRYIEVDENFINLQETKEKLGRFNKKDKKSLNDLNIQFKSYNFNDSTWIKKEALLKVLPVLKTKSEEVLKKSNFTQLQDSLGVYLVKIEDVLNLGDVAPLSHVKPTIKQIILNKRKLELIKELEKDITNDAIKNKKFETYKNN